MSAHYICCLFCLFNLILYVPANTFSVMSGRVFLGWISTKHELLGLAEGHNAVPSTRPEPATSRSRVKHSTTELLRSPSSYTQMYFWLDFFMEANTMSIAFFDGSCQNDISASIKILQNTILVTSKFYNSEDCQWFWFRLILVTFWLLVVSSNGIFFF